MGELGAILTLLHDAADRSSPARLTVVEWRHGPRSNVAFERFMASHHPAAGSTHSVGSGDPAAPTESSWSTTLSFERTDRFREESAGKQAGGRYLVRDGDRWVAWDKDWGATSSEADGEGGLRSSTYAFLLDPVGLVAALRLSPLSDGEVAGRRVRRVDATPRGEPGGERALFQIGAGADRVELAVDAERGALLRSEAFVDGEPFHRLEVTEIAFGPIPETTFTLALPPGADASQGWYRPVRLALHEFAATAPFAVFVPERLPLGWRLVESLFTPARERPPIEPEVFLTYVSGDGAYALNVRERAAGSQREEWLRWEPSGELELTDAGEHVQPRHYVRVEREGTLVELSGSELPLLTSLVAVLVPAPTGPPSL
jgi:hypothetical protein